MNTIEVTDPSWDQTQPTFEIRPGVKFPDWSVISSDVAKCALTDINEAFGIEKCFTGYDQNEDRVRMCILRYMAEHGCTPSMEKLADEVELLVTDVAVHLSTLKMKDLVVLDETMDNIVGAYPLTERTTEHLVEIGDQRIHAMCAIDALGTGSMFQTDITIKSSCRATGTPIVIKTGSNGTEIVSVDPATAIVWSGTKHSDGCAADI